MKKSFLCRLWGAISLMLGMTATLEGLCAEENNVLDAYQFTRRSYIPSTFQKKTLKVEETVVIPGEIKRSNGFFEEIRKEIFKIRRENRAALVVFADTARMNEFYEDFMKHDTSGELEQLGNWKKKVNDTAVISRAIAQYKVTLMTREYGRGIDFVCRDSALQESGGVHVILTFYPETETEEIQIMGRTCHQDDRGSFRKILWAEDLRSRGFVPETKDEQGNTKAHLEKFVAFKGEDWDRYLATERQKKYAEKFRKIHTELEKNKKLHLRSLDLVKAVENHEEERAFDLLGKYNDRLELI